MLGLTAVRHRTREMQPLGWFRAQGRSLATATFVLLSLAVGTNAATHGIGGHDDHGPVLVAHDASAHAFTDGSAAAQGESLHCVLCHLTRIVRPSLQPAQHAPAHDDRSPVVRWSRLQIPAVFPAAEPPLRSPPFSV